MIIDINKIGAACSLVEWFALWNCDLRRVLLLSDIEHSANLILNIVIVIMASSLHLLYSLLLLLSIVTFLVDDHDKSQSWLQAFWQAEGG